MVREKLVERERGEEREREGEGETAEEEGNKEKEREREREREREIERESTCNTLKQNCTGGMHIYRVAQNLSSKSHNAHSTAFIQRSVGSFVSSLIVDS